MNRITNAQRKPIQDYAESIVRINRQDWSVNDYQLCIDALIQRFGISRQRARGHVAKVARIIRGRML